DIKPSNLFLPGGAADGVKLLDFGVTRANAGNTLTQSGTLIGTPSYIAPEQARGGRSPDPRADVFALGCVLFECLAGRPAFAGEHMLAVLARILLEDPPRIADLSPELDELLERMLAKTPERRPRDAQAVLVELNALVSAGESAGQAGGKTSVPL